MDALFASAHKQAGQRKAAGKWGDRAGQLRGLLLPMQVRLERDPARRVAVRSARRNGKSTAALLIAAIRCLEQADSSWVVLGLTRGSVKRIYWLALQRLNTAFELGIKFQHQELTATFANGSRVYFTGAENRAEIEKLRGGQYDGVIVDECKSFAPSLFEELLQDVIEPALLDKSGQLYLIGTPGDTMAGEFYLATCEVPERIETSAGVKLSNALYGQRPAHPAIWSLHAWTLQDNVTRFREPRTGSEFTLWDEALKIKEGRGWADDHPTWRREYLGHWVPTDYRLVYRYRPHRHDYAPLADTRWGLPERDRLGNRIEWRTVCGWDFGSRDGTAAVVWAFSATEPGLWEVHSERRVSTTDAPLSVGVVAAWYKDLETEFGPFDGYPADTAGLATMVIDTLGAEHGVFLEPAEKTEKNDHIELFNSDLDSGLIHVRRGSELSAELSGNRWLERSVGMMATKAGGVPTTWQKRKEDPATPNDLCDAALYAFRWCRHRQARPAPRAQQMFSAEWWAAQASRELKAAEDRARAARGPAQLDCDWWADVGN